MYQLSDWDKVVEFHGHICPGLAVGYRAALAALRELQVSRSEDEQLVAIVENDACGVDAIQVLTGCSFGKGNLIFRDYGKHVFTIGRRSDGKAVRISIKKKNRVENKNYYVLIKSVLNGNATEEDKKTFKKIHKEKTERILNAPEEEILEITHVTLDLPRKAQIFQSVECAICGETVMEPRARIQNGKIICIPCSSLST
ncbi:MAG: formylmethanofuran dehydrogenase subunit [Clostridia bacterium]|nr:formylmethanofuran dehydrogenase subunit [Clostridia bacterium]